MFLKISQNSQENTYAIVFFSYRTPPVAASPNFIDKVHYLVLKPSAYPKRLSYDKPSSSAKPISGF